MANMIRLNIETMLESTKPSAIADPVLLFEKYVG
jgi:hypothetical protein